MKVCIWVALNGTILQKFFQIDAFWGIDQHTVFLAEKDKQTKRRGRGIGLYDGQHEIASFATPQATTGKFVTVARASKKLR